MIVLFGRKKKMSLKDDAIFRNNGVDTSYEHSLDSEKLMNESRQQKDDAVVEIKDERQNQLLYKVADQPPVYLTIFCGLQVLFG